MNYLKRSISTLAAATAVALLLGTGPAMAGESGDDNGGSGGGGGGGDRVIKVGSCTGSADWKLKVKTDNGRLEVEGEVDSNINGQRWAWTIRHNGSVSARGTATTVGPSGSFDVERRVVDLAGTDQVVFRAVHAGEVCRGVVNY